MSRRVRKLFCCISFDSYIKPQLGMIVFGCAMCCISFDSYIKPQLVLVITYCNLSCISFDSYIKPQRNAIKEQFFAVVYLLIPTSNHNLLYANVHHRHVVYLLIPTSNHNLLVRKTLRIKVVYLLIPTSNHNVGDGAFAQRLLYIF